ncbi:HK97-gp10 family putative phage morphogenesis protein [Rhizobacter sp. Root1221]|uniref:HK97-gp10 family putative phage morphogenesis protein n=1 Tax=Rhizobacter sp. Root1221 TaxID=1736433 RepID=UPI00070189F8|nr:HK97-gp10 family putative phage morphogenesis protein [Rhizobacter sp. Root1221]KQV85435.1 hypothetical protein ASC87_07015 [Rhizobacter sp. Root1221]
MARSIVVKGLRELGLKFKQLDEKVQKNVARSATSAGATVFKKEIARRAPVADEPYRIEDVMVEPRNLERNVVVKRLKPSQTSATSEHLVVMRGKRKYGYASRVAVLQEFGTVTAPAQPFFRPGADAAAQPAAAAVSKRFGDRIKKAIKDLET